MRRIREPQCVHLGDGWPQRRPRLLADTAAVSPRPADRAPLLSELGTPWAALGGRARGTGDRAGVAP